MIRTIDRATLQARRAANPRLIVLEALPQKYYDASHLPGALHFPHDEVGQRAPLLLPDRQTEIVVYCANRQCQNSHAAAQRLAALGYTNVSVYAGGKQDWIDAGLPVEVAPAAVTAV